MNKKHWWLLILMMITACSPGTSDNLSTASSTVEELPAPQVYITEAPYSRSAAEGFLNAWVAEDYNQMYAYLTKLSQDAISLEDFVTLYEDTAVNLSLTDLDYEILSTLTNPKSGQGCLSCHI